MACITQDVSDGQWGNDYILLLDPSQEADLKTTSWKHTSD